MLSSHESSFLPPLSQNIISRLAKKLAFMMPLTQKFLFIPRSYGMDISLSEHEDFHQIIANDDKHIGETSFAGLASSLPKETYDKTFLLSVFPNGKYELQEIKKQVIRQISDSQKVAVAIRIIIISNNLAAYGIYITAVGKSVSDYNNLLSGTVLYDSKKDTIRSLEDNLIFKLIPSNLEPYFVIRGSEDVSSNVSNLNKATALAEEQAALYNKK